MDCVITVFMLLLLTVSPENERMNHKTFSCINKGLIMITLFHNFMVQTRNDDTS